MNINFKTLCIELSLPIPYDGQELALNSLRDWCYENISQDVHYDDDTNEDKYSNYLALAEAYLDKFLPHVPRGLAQKTPAFDNLSAISYAAQKGYSRFIAIQPNIPEKTLNETDAYGMTPLHKAAIQGHWHTVLALLAQGANVHVMNAQKQLPIHSALFVPMIHTSELLQRKENIVRELLPLTPEALTMQDNDGNTLLHLLVTYGFDNLLVSLISTNPELALLKNNASIYPIHTAILNQKATAVDLLISIDGVSMLGDGQRRLPLHYAARYGTPEIVSSCCNGAASIDSRDAQGRTPLLWAAVAGNQKGLEILVKNGADTTLADYEGFSILHFAVKEQHEQMAHWIINNLGLSLLEQENIEKKLPLYYAKQNNNQRLIEFIEEKMSNGRG